MISIAKGCHSREMRPFRLAGVLDPIIGLKGLVEDVQIRDD